MQLWNCLPYNSPTFKKQTQKQPTTYMGGQKRKRYQKKCLPVFRHKKECLVISANGAAAIRNISLLS